MEEADHDAVLLFSFSRLGGADVVIVPAAFGGEPKATGESHAKAVRSLQNIVLGEGQYIGGRDKCLLVIQCVQDFESLARR